MTKDPEQSGIPDDLKEVRSLVKRAELRHYARLSWWPFVELWGHLALIGAAVATQWQLFMSPGIPWGIKGFCYLIMLLVVGSRQRALVNIVHECSHGVFTPLPLVNTIVGNLLAAVDCTTFRKYKKEHFSHHAYLGRKDKDLDLTRRWNQGFANPGLGLDHHLKFALRGKAIEVHGTMVLWLLPGYWWGWWVPVIFWLLPHLLIYQTLKYLSDAFDHAGIIATPGSGILKSRNHLVKSTLLRFFLFPRHDEYHLVHHLYPTLPVGSLEQVHRTLQSRSDFYNGLVHDLSLQLAGHPVLSSGTADTNGVRTHAKNAGNKEVD